MGNEWKSGRDLELGCVATRPQTRAKTMIVVETAKGMQMDGTRRLQREPKEKIKCPNVSCFLATRSTPFLPPSRPSRFPFSGRVVGCQTLHGSSPVKSIWPDRERAKSDGSLLPRRPAVSRRLRCANYVLLSKDRQDLLL